MTITTKKNGEKYIGKTFQENDGTSYRSDGSVMFKDETKACNTMVSHSKTTGNENFAALTNEGVLMLPEYKNDAGTVNLEDYGYSINQKGNIVD